MDVWINFKNATKWQAEGIFKCFFPSASLPTATATEADAKSGTDKGSQQSAQSCRKHGVPLLSAEELEALAKKFAAAIPEDEMSVSSLQGYLLKNKVRLSLVAGLCGW
jgi:chaperone BCS1